MLAALASPHRLRIIAALKTDGRNYVSQLAREVGIRRPLLPLHLQKLEEAAPFCAAIGCPRLMTYLISSSETPKDELRRLYKARISE